MLVGLMGGCGASFDPINPVNPWSPGAQVGPTSEPVPIAPVSPEAAMTTSTIPDATTVRAVEQGRDVNGRSVMRVGDLLRVMFTDVLPQIPPHDVRIREDGSITLPYNVRVQAQGKTVRELEEAIHAAYVPHLYKVLTVTVATHELF